MIWEELVIERFEPETKVLKITITFVSVTLYSIYVKYFPKPFYRIFL